MTAAPATAPFTLEQAVALYDSCQTAEDLVAAHTVCDAVAHAFNNDDRGRVVRAFVAATSRVWVARSSPAETDLSWHTPTSTA